MAHQKPILLFVPFFLLSLLTHSFLLLTPQKSTSTQEIFDLEADQLKGGSITNYEQWTNDSFAKSTQMNTVFKYITGNPLILNNITKKVNNSVSYVIYPTRTTLYYYNDNQKAQFYLPDNIVAITDGFAQVDIRFSWIKTGQKPVNGTGSASGFSEQIGIGFKFNNKSSQFPTYEVVNCLPFSCNNLSLSEISGILTPEDIEHITSMLSASPNKETLSSELKYQVNQIYAKYIGWFFNDKSPITNKKFQYTWQNPAAASIVYTYNFTRDPFFFVFANTTTIYYGYWNDIDDYPNPSDGPKIPTQKYDPNIYGGAQSYITLKFIQDLLSTAAIKGQFDTTLERSFWVSRYFNFMAGEIYDSYPSLQKITAPDTQIAGNCKADQKSISVTHFSDNTLNVTVTSRCNMSVLLQQRTKFTQFEIQLSLEVAPRAHMDSMDFWLKSFSQLITYFPMPEFPIADKATVDKLIVSVLGKLYENKLFGSGWPTYPNRWSPGVMIDKDEILIYDKWRQ